MIVKLSRRRYLALGVTTLMAAIVVVASSITATAPRSEVNEAKAIAQTGEKKQEENKKPEGKVKEKPEEKNLPQARSILAPLLFALICIELSAVLAWLLVLIGVGLSPGVNPNPQNLGVPSVLAPNSPIASVILAPIGGLPASLLRLLYSSCWLGWSLGQETRGLAPPSG
jgi:hypothetical protein